MLRTSMALSFFILLSASSASWAELTPGAKFFIGRAGAHSTSTAKCYVELLYSANLAEVSARLISPLEHFSPSGASIWVAVGPYTARYIASRSLYRYQDATPGARVKDLVIHTNGPTNPTRLSFLFWHAEAGHHDPVHCQNLKEAQTAEELNEVEDRFKEFESGHSH